MDMSLKFKKISESKTQFNCLNDIHDVIEGKRPVDKNQLWVDASQYACGLGNGSTTTINALGESILVNGMAYTKSSDQQAPDYYKLSLGKKFMTSWMFMMPPHAEPVYEVSHEGADLQATVYDIYAAIYEKINAPFVVAGVIRFDNLKGAAIAKAPIENQNIFDHKAIYYPYQTDLQDVSAAIVGVAADVKNIHDGALQSAIKKVVYYNPLENDTHALTTHEHVLILKDHVTDIAQVSQHNAADVQHLFTQSTVKRCRLNVYAIGEISTILTIAD